MRVVDAVSWSSKPHNEDAYGFRADGLWVLDGASALGAPSTVEGMSGAAWLSATASAFLATVSWDGRQLTDVLADLLDHVAEQGRRIGLGKADPACSDPSCSDCSERFPTATLSLARQRDGDLLDLCLLGDSPIVLAEPGGRTRVFLDPQFAGVEERLLEPVRAGIAAGDDPGAVYRRARAVLLERRRRRNTAGGAWVLSDVPEAARHAFTCTLRLRGGEELLAMSDGFARLVEPFGLVSDHRELLAAVGRGEAESLLRRLREAERADPDCSRYPRFGVSDDATVIHAVL